MPTRIAHLSDLHFGGEFDEGIWRAVSETVINENPHLVIVSGDLVDSPDPDHLYRAKKELEKLGADAKAKLFIVPGNHDVFYLGNDIVKGRIGWFDYIFKEGGVPGSRVLSGKTGFAGGSGRHLAWVPQMLRNFLGGYGKEEDPAVPPTSRAGPSEPEIFELTDLGVLLALLDSNAADQPVGFATGSVLSEHILKLDSRLKQITTPHLVRIAVVHHHVLPVSYTVGKLVGGEPFMVFHNAGTVLDMLARHRFDLVLHGHKHLTQFARIDFAPHTAEGYPIAVAAAGSACLRTPNNPRGNSFNLITVDDNGRMVVRALYYGAEKAPRVDGQEGDDYRIYSETIESVKRRAFIRARQRHRIFCRECEQSFNLTENGDLEIRWDVRGLYVTRGTQEYRRRPHVTYLPPQGRLAIGLQLDPVSQQRGYRIESRTAGEGELQRGIVLLPETPSSTQPTSYVVTHSFANCMMMTRWEAEQRAKTRPPSENDLEEWVGWLVSFPIDTMVLALTLPQSLSAVTPFVRCRRPRGFPNFTINDTDDVDEDMRKLPADDDRAMSEEEAPHLNYDPALGRWKLVVRQPMVGYLYELHWKVPGELPDESLSSETLQSQELLLKLRDRVQANTLLARDKIALGLFADLCRKLDQTLAWGGPDEKRSMELFVFDPASLVLRPALSHRSWINTPMRWDFEIPLGAGIAGAAFQQRRIVPWRKGTGNPAFIAPVPYPHTDDEAVTEMRAMLAVPVYHPTQLNAGRPLAGSAIGVLSFGSDAAASKFTGLLNRTLAREDEKRLNAVRGAAQGFLNIVIRLLTYGTVPGEAA
jgi:predicted phosphodiesterase